MINERGQTLQKTATDCRYGLVVVAAAFMIHFIVGGILYSVGVLYTEFINEFGQGKGNTAWLSSFSAGIMMLIGPIAGALTSRFGCRRLVLTGAAIATTGFVLCLFANNILYLFLSFGILPGVGFGFILLPTLVYVNRYFEKKRSLAIGMVVCGTGVGIFAFPPIVRFLINEYGWRGTILIEAGSCCNIVLFGAFLKPIIYSNESHRLEEKKQQADSRCDMNRTSYVHCFHFFSRHFEFQLMTNRVYLIFTASNLLTALGYGTPFTYLPDRAEEKGITSSNSAFLISVMGISNLLGRPIFGWLADQKYVNRLLLYGVSICICGVANFLNPVDDSYEYLLMYAAILGTFGGVFISLNTVVLGDLIGLDQLGKGFGLLQVFRGIGIFIGPPITGWLYDGTGSYDASFYFIGLCMSLGGILALFIPVQQTMSINRHQSKRGNNMNLETKITRF